MNRFETGIPAGATIPDDTSVHAGDTNGQQVTS
jgi:hypothetical protein